MIEQECEAVIEITGLRDQYTEIEMNVVYFRGYNNSVGYLKRGEASVIKYGVDLSQCRLGVYIKNFMMQKKRFCGMLHMKEE